MNQINVNPGREPLDTVDHVDTGDRTAAAGINLITVLIVLAVPVVIAWYLFTGPLRVGGSSGSTTNINVNPAPPTTNINPPGGQPNAPSPGGNNPGTGGNTSTGAGGGAGTGNNQPANP